MMMKINVQNQKEVLSLLEQGRKVEGRLWMELNEDGKYEIFFGRYNRKPQGYRWRDKLICYLEHGRVMESPERIKVYESVPKRLGAAGIGHVLQREAKDATAALRDCELEEVIFC
ncbi:MAG: hypothetical protein IKP41_04600 [Bacteroidaceae bacterium]|nr:hypothetical protein [Bacteroidaceae bacterium]